MFYGVGNGRLYDYEDIKKVPIWNRMAKAREYLDHNFNVGKNYMGFVFFAATD